MSSDPVPETPEHPLERLVVEFEQALADSSEGRAWTLTPSQLTALLPRLERVRRQLDGRVLAMLREADRHQVGDRLGFAVTAGWWAQVTRQTKPAAFKDVRLAEALDTDVHAPVAEALGRGEVSVDQAHVVVAAVDALPSPKITNDLRATAEAELVGLAEHHDPRELRILGRRILDVVAPEISEAHEAQLLEGEEREAWATAYLRARSDGHGSQVGEFKLPDAVYAMLHKHVAAYAAPRHRHAVPAVTGPDGYTPTPDKPSERVSRQLSLGQAFIEYISTRPVTPEGTPKAGGMPATIVVTMTREALVGESERAGLLDTGETISAAAARRIACGAGIIPTVLGSKSVVLDQGRKTRFHTEAQRFAIAVRDKGCIVEDCDWPPGMCHTHHLEEWSKGGNTNTRDGALICPPHHHKIHDTNYTHRFNENGKIQITRRE